MGKLKYIKLFEGFEASNIKKGDKITIRKERLLDDSKSNVSIGTEYTGFLKDNIERGKPIVLIDDKGNKIMNTSLITKLHKRGLGFMTTTSEYSIKKIEDTLNKKIITNKKNVLYSTEIGDAVIDLSGFEKRFNSVNYSSKKPKTLEDNQGLENIFKKGYSLLGVQEHWLFKIGSSRLVMFFEKGGKVIPVYFSSKGTSGKSITWHPFFGMEPEFTPLSEFSGWIAKKVYDPEKSTIQDITDKDVIDLMYELYKNFRFNEEEKQQLLKSVPKLNIYKIFQNNYFGKKSRGDRAYLYYPENLEIQVDFLLSGKALG